MRGLRKRTIGMRWRADNYTYGSASAVDSMAVLLSMSSVMGSHSPAVREWRAESAMVTGKLCSP